MLRKVKANIPTRHAASRQFARKIARQFLGRPDRDDPQLEVIEPPMEYLQEDLVPFETSFPSEFLIMLRNIR
ncbi:UNVERIFIED_CONTAM: hypothetical protein GTU68_004700 [Idotea baltica]|nr:hypothetical protein [Idotea baltica]